MEEFKHRHLIAKHVEDQITSKFRGFIFLMPGSIKSYGCCQMKIGKAICKTWVRTITNMQMSTVPAYAWKNEERKRQRSKNQNQDAGRGAGRHQIIALWETQGKKGWKHLKEEGQMRMNWFCLISSKGVWKRNKDLNFFIWYCLCKKARAVGNKIKTTYRATIFSEHTDCKRKAGRRDKKASIWWS